MGGVAKLCPRMLRPLTKWACDDGGEAQARESSTAMGTVLSEMHENVPGGLFPNLPGRRS